MNLIELLQTIHVPCSDNRQIMNISDDSREIQKDWLFIAHSGVSNHGESFVEEALQKGAVVLQEAPSQKENVYNIAHLDDVIPVLLYIFYQEPWRHLCMIGVTGTNGKSSVVNVVKQLLEMNDHQVMSIGTGHIHYKHQDIEIGNTTPSVFTIMRYLAKAIEWDIDTVVMEVSSHAIDQHRIRGIFFDIIMYSNITQDHLDYHLSKTHYQYTKFKLRNALKQQGVIILNNDDDILEKLYELSYHKIITCGTKQAHYVIHQIDLQDNHSSFSLHTYEFRTNLLGLVNIYNITQAIMVCRYLQIPYPKLQQDIAKLSPVEGRLQCLLHTNRTIWIDYAHTYMAVKTLLDFANKVKKGNVILVVGCGGEREIEKRALIGEYAHQHCDVAIFTSDNPRNENIQNILFDMMPTALENIEFFENRWYAIKHAIKIAENSDIIVIAGKGNEKTQAIMGKEYLFHDEQCVYEILEREEFF